MIISISFLYHVSSLHIRSLHAVVTLGQQFLPTCFVPTVVCRALMMIARMKVLARG